MSAESQVPQPVPLNREETQSILDGLDLLPSRKMGQSFLCEPESARSIVSHLDAEPEATVVEIGGGLGALTDHLSERPGKLMVVEKDGRLARHLASRFDRRKNVKVIEGDGTSWDPRPLFINGGAYLVGNLPYSEAAGILWNFLGEPSSIRGGVLMLQKEMALRLCAKPKTKNYGAMTVRLARRWVFEFAETLGPEPFHPVPKVDSTVISFTPRPADELPPCDIKTFEMLVKAGFSQRRKQIKKLLPAGAMAWPEMAEKLGVELTARGEELSVAQWVTLTRLHSGLGVEGNEEGQSADEIFDVVDDNNEVVRQEKRGVVHAEGLKHRATHIFLFNKHGDLYLQRRSRLKDVNPLRWGSSAAGHVDAGEDYEVAAKREIEEELGLSDIELTEAGNLEPSESNGQEFIRVFVGQTKLKPSPDPIELDTGGFFSVETVKKWIETRPGDFSGGFLECFSIWESSQA